MNNDPRNIMPGDRVMVFDPSLFVDDVKTPLSHTVRPATVVCRYGYRFKCGELTGPEGWLYPDCVDVLFDHKARISEGHFTSGVHVL